MILCGRPSAQYRAHRAEIDAAVSRVFDGEQYVLGAEVKAFEAEFATYCDSVHGIGVNSGTDALILSLRALGIGAGDEVITVSHTAVATVAAIEAAGATAVTADIDDYFTLDPQALERAVTPRTKAVIVVHLYGQPAHMDAVMAVAERRGLKVIEDCAQATGARYKGRRVGSFGDCGCFSFYPTKNLGAIGDGGMIVTGDAGLAERVRALREYGWAGDRISHVPGVNSRLDEIQAAVLRVKLPHLDADNARRDAIAQRYGRELAGLPLTLPTVRAECRHVWHLYVARCAGRDSLIEALKGHGIAAGVHYRQAAHQQPAYAGRLKGADTLAATERAVTEIITLPIYPELTDDQVDKVIAAVRAETVNG